MSTVSLTLPSDGDTIDASDVNNPLNAIAAVVNGGIDSTNVTAGGLTPNSLTSGTGTSWAWQSFTPTVSGNLVVGNGTITGAYLQIGKTIFAKAKVVFGSSSSIGSNAQISLPVAENTTFLRTTNTIIGNFSIWDNSTSNSFFGVARYEASGLVRVLLHSIGTAGSITATSSSIPMTWAVSDELVYNIVYEAA